MDTLNCLAIDLGATSGRGILGRYDGRVLAIEEAGRFENNPATLCGHTYWNLLQLYQSVQDTMGAVAAGNRMAAMGVDGWGVDYCLFDSQDELMGNPYHYRDVRVQGMIELAAAKMPLREIYRRTGISFEKFNTLFQLLAEANRPDSRLQAAKRLLFIPDVLAWFLTGEAATDRTLATTTQLLDAATHRWDDGLLAAMGIPAGILPHIVPAGTVRGRIARRLEATGMAGVPLMNVAGHDTASAIAAVPSEKTPYAFISSGTWSLMGVTGRRAIVNDETFALNYSNELSADGTVLLKNIIGMWLIEECRRSWRQAGLAVDYDGLYTRAAAAPAFACLIDPNHGEFYAAGDMPGKIARYCAATGQPPPADEGGVVRCIIESLALTYRDVFQDLRRLAGAEPDCLHIIGGGCQNVQLNQATADAIHRPVVASPREATAYGNLCVQLVALGELADVGQARQLVLASDAPVVYQPRDASLWDAQYERYLGIRRLAADVGL